MKNVKHIIAIFIVLCILSAVAFIFQKSNFAAEFFVNGEETVKAVADTSSQDTIPFVERFKNNLQVLPPVEGTKKKKKNTWVLGKGRTIIHYLLQAQKFLNENGGKALYMEELHDDRTQSQAARLIAETPDGDTLTLTLEVSESIFRDNASYLSIAFQVTNLTPELVVGLNELDYPFDLLVTPFNVGDRFFDDLDRIRNKELVLWLLMESPNLDSRHRKMKPIRIHHTEEQIEGIINEAKNLVPNAQGIATRFGERAVEHKQLLEAIFNSAQKQQLWFADLTQDQKSITSELCKENSISCKEINPYNPSNSTLDDYIRQKLRGAARNGIAAMIIPLSKENIAKVKSLKAKANSQGSSIVNLSTFIKF